MHTITIDTSVDTAAAVVSATNLTRRYGQGETAIDALRGISLDIAPARLTAIMGPSGSGKSTLMHILAGLDRPTAGSVTLAGMDITKLDDDPARRELRREHIGFVFQFFNLLPMLTVERERRAPARTRRRARPTATGSMSCSPRPASPPAAGTGRRSSRAGSSSAWRSRARSCRGPTVDVRGRADGQPRLAHGRARSSRCCASPSTALGQTTVMVTHDAHAAAIADRILFLADGHDRRATSARPRRTRSSRRSSR